MFVNASYLAQVLLIGESAIKGATSFLWLFLFTLLRKDKKHSGNEIAKGLTSETTSSSVIGTLQL